MKKRKQRAALSWAFFLMSLMVFFGCACGSTTSGTGRTSSSASVSTNATVNEGLLTSFTGSNSVSMSGTWTNNTFSTTGDVASTISYNQATNVATLVFDLDGSVYGGGDPAAETFTIDLSTFLANGTDVLTATSATHGDISVTLTFLNDNTGTFTGTATNEPTGSVTNASFSGSFSISGSTVTVTVDNSAFTFLGTPVTCGNSLTTTLN
ncbi:MAG: hypothetical protein HY609_06280 [Deltaproteobacteria bacterium]|nr:hypothetical protein [Deltaproteobacteria bacterium]MBI4224525.1 hypothetical protein [Deltaproteobacteria bacterium]